MRLLFISFELGVTSSGIASDRVARQLAEHGHHITGLVGAQTPQERPFEVWTASPFPLKPARFYSLLGNLIGRDLNYVFWERRAIKLGLSLIDKHCPDVIYARGSPACAFSVGLHLSERTGIPLAIHFADPIPATPDWQAMPAVREKMRRTVLPAQRHASLVSFGNDRMRVYQEKTTEECIGSRCMILPNPIPVRKPCTPLVKKNAFVFTFIGSFFGSRRPDSLLQAFSVVAQRHADVRLHIYGVCSKEMKGLIYRDACLARCVDLFGWTSDVASALSESSCLIDVDPDVDDCVYTSNKLMDYLSVDRPILAITPRNSASREVLEGLKESCVLSDHAIENIVGAMETAIASDWGISAFEERRELRSAMSLESVCRHLENRLEGLIRR
ncbi:glycosyltransferase [Accumulibacter sp.]|uniref:glycosyltransferase n=1 Tax=Accumulibacter sp. TaxID=2053492 RepID=UPI00260A1923|nr:glycosyltransferase [Accumulibacter sp.]